MDMVKAHEKNGKTEPWRVFQQDLDAWMISFRQTFGACMDIVRGKEPVFAAPVALGSINILFDGDFTRAPEGSYVDFSNEDNAVPAEQGAGAAVKTAMLLTNESGQDAIIAGAENCFKQFGLDAMKVFASAMNETCTFVAAIVAGFYSKTIKKGVPTARKKDMGVRMAACSLAIAVMLYGTGPALGSTGIFGQKTLESFASAENPESVIETIFNSQSSQLQVSLMKVLGNDWEAEPSNDGFKEMSRIVTKNIPATVRDEAVRELRQKAYSLFDYVEKTRFAEGKSLNDAEKDAFVRPLTMMFALLGDTDSALALQLIAKPDSFDIFNWLERSGGNPFALVQKLANLSEKSRARNLVVQAARYMYGEKDEQKVFEHVLNSLENILNSDLKRYEKEKLAKVTGLEFQSSPGTLNTSM